MRRRFRLPILLAATFLLFAWTAQGAGLEVRDAAIATGIIDRAPVGVGDSFPAQVERLYAFTRIMGGTGDTFVTHVWYHAGKEMARVKLPVRGPDWRTWSSKSILPAWKGQWLVEVEGPDGKVLHSLPFVIE